MDEEKKLEMIQWYRSGMIFLTGMYLGKGLSDLEKADYLIKGKDVDDLMEIINRIILWCKDGAFDPHVSVKASSSETIKAATWESSQLL